MSDAAATMNCLMCGAPARTDATHCEHCGARLATVACPSCFAMIFQGSRFCCHCGAAVNRRENDASGLTCPHCETELRFLEIGKIELAECSKCDGLWLENAAFEDVCADRDQQAALLGSAVAIPVTENPLKVKYVKCPVCRALMNRHNFSGASGVVIDLCKPHGVWFDAYELQRIIAFIRGGGLERARQKQIQELEYARRRLEDERNRNHAPTMPDVDYSYSHRGGIADAIAEAVFSLIHF